MCNLQNICKKLFLKNNIFWKWKKMLHHTVLYLHFLYLTYWTVEHYPKSFLKTLRHNLTLRLLTIANQLWCKIANLTVNKVDITMSLQFSRSHIIWEKTSSFFPLKNQRSSLMKNGVNFFGVDFRHSTSFFISCTVSILCENGCYFVNLLSL